MGGANASSADAEGRRKADAKDVNEWLQIIIDALGSEYGWNKEEIFNAFPQEIEILMRRIRERRQQMDDVMFMHMITAARVPMMEDSGQSILQTIAARYGALDASPVTKESIEKDLAIARSLLAR